MTTVGLFTPRRRDGRSEWRVVYDAAVDLEPGGVLTYEQLLEWLERDRGQMPAVYAAVARAARELRRRRSRSLAVVPKVGYKVLHATEHEAQSEGYRQQANRRMRTGLEVLQSTDLTQLTPEQRTRSMAATMVLENLVYTVESVAKRQEMMDHALSTVIARNMEMDQRISRLERAKRDE